MEAPIGAPSAAIAAAAISQLETVVSGSMLDRCFGMFLAHAIGDAIGFQTEFSPQQISGLLEIAPVHHSRFQGTRRCVVGQVSDDTMMTLTALHCITQNQGFNRDRMILAYEEFANNTSLLGKNTRSLFKGVSTVTGYQGRWTKAFSQIPETEITQSNGSLMRAAALVFMTDTDVATDCRLSNPNSRNVECSLSYVNLLRELLRGQPPAVATTIGMRSVTDTLLLDRTSQNLLTPEQNRGWVVHAWHLAFHAAFESDFSDWVVRTLNTYPRSDTDTVAAIGGAVIGAKLGIRALLQEPMFRRNLEIILSADTNLGDRPHPAWLHPTSYLTLVPRYVQMVGL